MNELQQILLDLQKQYPKACLSDYVKLIHQNEFGCAHFIGDEEASLARLKEECQTARRGAALFEKLGNGYRRVYLKNALELGAAFETLNRMFLVTAQNSHGSVDRYQRKLQEFLWLCQTKKLPFSEGMCHLYMLNYAAAGYPAVHHSADYQAAYAPSYRVIGENYARFFELFLRIDRLLRTQKNPSVIAIDGPCASGKTTLAGLLQTVYDCNIFHTDDFYLRPEQKTPARLREAGGNMDRERLAGEVLCPLAAVQDVLYRPYSCKTQTISEGIHVPFKRLNIVEGSYSLHPELRHFYDIKVVLDLSQEHQMSRLKRRESRKSLELFRDRWIPLENEYRAATDLLDCADLVYPY